MKLELIRKWFTDTSTIGGLLIDGRFECFTLEDKARPVGVKVKGRTAIPEGHYQVVVDYSTRFGRYMPRLLNVPNFSGVRIHPGNSDVDTEGCILVGHSKRVDSLLESRKAYAELFEEIAQAVGDGVDEKGNVISIYRVKEPTTITITSLPMSDTRTDEEGRTEAD